MTTNKQTYWHFLREDRKLGYGDGRLVIAGDTLSVPGPLEMCNYGLHASKNLLDALKYAPGSILCKVELGSDVITQGDKSVSSSRKTLWMTDISDLLHKFACDAAEQCLKDRESEGIEVDIRSYAAIEAKRGWLRGSVTDSELQSARSAAESARSAAWSARSARSAADSAAWSAAESAQNTHLTKLVENLINETS